MTADGLPMDVQDLWKRLLLSLQGELDPEEIDVWFAHVAPVEVGAEGLVLAAENRYYQEWFRDNLVEVLERRLAHLLGRRVPVVVRAGASPVDDDPAPTPSSRSTGVYPGQTFETFVVGECNKLAHAAAQAVADRPARLYNPLYIYGSTGLGKTHLMHAIGNEILRRNPSSRVVYVTGEDFTNEMINAIVSKRTELFREKYREQADVLLIDDIQFISGKQRTQEEFFFTFNKLQAAGRQIVMTSDVEPKDIEGLEPRLRTRFEGGLVADMQPPDLETLVAILRKKAAEAELPLPHDLAVAIAEVAHGSIREIEGVILRLTALTKVYREPVTLEFARKHLPRVFAPEPPSITTMGIIEAVARFHNLKPADLVGQRRTRALTEPRHQAMYLARKHTKLSFPELGREFGDRDHSTIQHGSKKVDAELATNPDLAAQIKMIEHSLGLRH
jgi:chromosomal replication initiator protein